MTKLVSLSISFWVIRAFCDTVSTIVVSKTCNTLTEALVCGVLHKIAFWTNLYARVSCLICKCLWNYIILAFITTYSWIVVSKAICSVRITWRNTLSRNILAIRIYCRWTDIYTHCCQGITPIFGLLSVSVITEFNTFLCYLTTKKSIWTCVWTHVRMRVSVDWFIFGTLSYT